MSDHAAVETQRLAKRFGETPAVDDVNIRVEEGAVYGLLGRNGAGKTTLLRMLLGLLPPDAGSVRLFGEDAEPADVRARDDVAGFVEEPRFYPYLSAARNLELLRRLDGKRASFGIDEALELVGLDNKRREKVGNFSTGMRQRLGLAAALLRTPRLLVLDEPTIGLDPANARDVRVLLQEAAGRGVTVFVSSHNMSEVAEICSNVAIVRAGRVVWDGTLERLRDEAPAPAHRLSTSDDARAFEIGRAQSIDVDGRWEAPLTIRADDAARDAFVLALARAGIAVRRLEPDVQPLEALFTALTGDAIEPAEPAA